jgi:dTDP-4-dehydrorhamnose reductase
VRVLLFGRDGHLGSELVRQAPARVVLSAVTRTEADLLDGRAVQRAIEATRPEWVVNAAAWTNVDSAEREREPARAVNAEAVGRIGELAASHGARVLHFSTDYVFAGSARDYTEDDPTAPVNWYGETKAAGERLLLAAQPEAAIARVQWLFSARRPCFPRLMWQRARSRTPTRVVADQVGRPSHVEDVARAAWALLLAGGAGIYHATSEGPPASRYEIARMIFTALDAAELVTPCASDQVPTPATRPSRCVLSNDRLRRATGTSLPDWRDAIARFLEEARSQRDAAREAPTRG